MIRPTFEVADIVLAQGNRFVDRHRKWLSYQQLNVLRAIARCRTSALGGHLDACSRCGHQAISYNSSSLTTTHGQSASALVSHLSAGNPGSSRNGSAGLITEFTPAFAPRLTGRA